MGFETEFLEMMPLTMTVETFEAVDAYDSPVFGAANTWQCRIEQDSREFRNTDGVVAVADAVIFTPPTSLTSPAAVIGPKDRVTLPDGAVPLIQGVIREYDDEGFHHYEVYVSMSPSRA